MEVREEAEHAGGAQGAGVKGAAVLVCTGPRREHRPPVFSEATARRRRGIQRRGLRRVGAIVVAVPICSVRIVIHRGLRARPAVR